MTALQKGPCLANEPHQEKTAGTLRLSALSQQAVTPFVLWNSMRNSELSSRILHQPLQQQSDTRQEALRIQTTHHPFPTPSSVLLFSAPCLEMAWLFGSGKKAPPGQSESKAARDRQIANLHERVPGLQIKSNDNSLYEIRIAAPPDGAMVMLRVFLPTKFPTDRPGESSSYYCIITALLLICTRYQVPL